MTAVTLASFAEGVEMGVEPYWSVEDGAWVPGGAALHWSVQRCRWEPAGPAADALATPWSMFRGAQQEEAVPQQRPAQEAPVEA